MQTAAKDRMTAAEFLKFERSAEERHEFLNGEVLAMSGGSYEHSMIGGNILGELRSALRGKPRQPLNIDMRVKIEATGLHTYPDVSVACPPLEFADGARDTLLNPRVIFEVLSPSTAAYNRGNKFWHYRHLDSLEEYIIVAQDEWLVEHYRRQANGGWLLESLDASDAELRLETLGCGVRLEEIFANTEVTPMSRN